MSTGGRLVCYARQAHGPPKPPPYVPYVRLVGTARPDRRERQVSALVRATEAGTAVAEVGLAASVVRGSIMGMQCRKSVHGAQKVNIATVIEVVIVTQIATVETSLPSLVAVKQTVLRPVVIANSHDILALAIAFATGALLVYIASI